MPQVDVPEDVHARLAERAEEKGFDSTEAYIRDVLEQVVARLEQDDKDGYSADDEERVRERLERLGYM